MVKVIVGHGKFTDETFVGRGTVRLHTEQGALLPLESVLLAVEAGVPDEMRKLSSGSPIENYCLSALGPRWLKKVRKCLGDGVELLAVGTDDFTDRFNSTLLCTDLDECSSINAHNCNGILAQIEQDEEWVILACSEKLGDGDSTSRETKGVDSTRDRRIKEREIRDAFKTWAFQQNPKQVRDKYKELPPKAKAMLTADADLDALVKNCRALAVSLEEASAGDAIACYLTKAKALDDQMKDYLANDADFTNYTARYVLPSHGKRTEDGRIPSWIVYSSLTEDQRAMLQLILGGSSLVRRLLTDGKDIEHYVKNKTNPLSGDGLSEGEKAALERFNGTSQNSGGTDEKAAKRQKTETGNRSKEEGSGQTSDSECDSASEPDDFCLVVSLIQETYQNGFHVIRESGQAVTAKLIVDWNGLMQQVPEGAAPWSVYAHVKENPEAEVFTAHRNCLIYNSDGFWILDILPDA
ncbi:hypothetical protein ACTVZO_39290 [Streptomyces sp. IBSNAI002]|uniref:hypothetical protein n=1 Tax=Streptomyces sp. IBSNAI002 TaxID=3457500 RepID=UPI003FD01056